jgi:hypothetical protein
MCINFHEFMFSYEPENDEKSNNFFIQQFLIHANQVLFKTSIL